VITGIVGIVIGYVGGFTLLPFITVFEIPVVSTVMIVPSLMGIYYHIRLESE